VNTLPMDRNGNLDWFDPENIRLTAEDSVHLHETKRRRRKPTGEYLKAVPWAWVIAAANLPGRALVIALVIYHRVTMSRTDRVTLRGVWWGELRASHKTVRRALRDLERADLIAVERRPGRLLRVGVKFDSPIKGD
jgi:hypothetical protein